MSPPDAHLQETERQTCDWCAQARQCKTYADDTDMVVICARCDQAMAETEEAER